MRTSSCGATNGRCCGVWRRTQLHDRSWIWIGRVGKKGEDGNGSFGY